MDVRIISIGTLATNPEWGEHLPMRTGHATCTLIRQGDLRVLVDPGLPVPAMLAKLHERAGMSADDVTHVFLTRFHPDTTRGIRAFEHATWWIGETEREHVGIPLASRLRDLAAGVEEAEDEIDPEVRRELEYQIALLQRCEAAPDHLMPQVDLFPLPGVTPGLCGVLVSRATSTLLLTGDAIPTVEYLEQGKVHPDAQDVTKARESLAEAIEIADEFILGRDNVVTMRR
ncbi:MAG: MBL fold metallo-hydrolase [Phycisphaerales bacterium]|nr:MBL fold metallo-hydrolase [Phycisphaerales bacterium]